MFFDLDKFEKLLKAEWAVIWQTPYSFVAAVLVGWLIVWLLLRAWYGRSIRISADRISLLENARDIERRQKEGLRQAILELKPDAQVLAMEVGHGDPAIQSVVKALASGEKISTPVNPATPQVHLFINAPASEEELKKIAALAYTSANGLSQVFKFEHDVTVSSSTASTISVAGYIAIKDPQGRA